MKNWSIILSVLACGILLLGSCTTGSDGLVSPDINPGLTGESNLPNTGTRAPVHLWGYYEVGIDPESKEVSTVLNRTAMFTANCTNFLNSTTGGIGFDIYNINNTPDYIDIDLIVALRHPFPGLPKYNGYDVRGVFMGEGSGVMGYNSSLLYPVSGEDQSFQPDLTDPDGADGHPDGYTRWFNMTEFSGPGMPLLTYTQGKMASPGYMGSATLCPYKYFADSLGANDSLPNWLEENPDKHGKFSSGAVNDRDYKLRFPAGSPILFGYAVIANWNGPEPDNHPGNAPESIGCRAEQGGDVYYVDDTSWGGSIELTLDIFDWGVHQLSTFMEDYVIYIESTALVNPYLFDAADMTPIGGGENYSTYYVEISADDLHSAEGNEYWVIVECADADYSNEFGVMNDAWNDPLAAYFRYDLEVANFLPTQAPVCDLQVDPCTLHYWDITDHVTVKFDASASYDPDGDAISFHWDFDGDENYDEPGDDDYTGAPETPSRDYYEDGVCNLKVEDDNGAFSECSIDVDISEHESKNIPLRQGWVARDLAVDPANGDLHLLYYWHNTANDTHWTETWKYSPCDCYAEPPGAFHAQPQGKMFHRIDVSGTHYSVIGGPLQGASGQVRNITPEGVDLGPNWIINCTEVWCYNETGNWGYDHCTIYPFPAPPWNPTGYSTFLYRSDYQTTFSTWEQSAMIYWSYQPIGYDVLYAGNLKGLEPEAEGESFWCVKDPGNASINDYFGTRFRLSSSPAGLSGVDYDNAWFGTGTQTDEDTCWYNAKDLTRNADDVLIVLDELSDGTGRVKGFTGDASGGTSLGGFNLPDDINDTPVRIDSSDYIDPIYGNLLYILHGDDTGGYLLSIYFPDELPW